MLSLARIIVYLLEGLSITVAIYLISKKQLATPEFVTLALSISVTFMILDLFAPGVAGGARQGSGFGLGFQQVAGNPNGMPIEYYGGRCANGQCTAEPVLEGMDDPVALQYYQQYNPYHPPLFPPTIATTGLDQSLSDVTQTQTQVVNDGTQTVGSGAVPIPVQPVTSQTVGAPTEGFEGNLGRQYAKNPFQTTVRSVTEIDGPGANYKNGFGVVAKQIPGRCETEPVIYSPLTPTYGYRYQLPRGWDQLEQPNLGRATQQFQGVC